MTKQDIDGCSEELTLEFQTCAMQDISVTMSQSIGVEGDREILRFPIPIREETANPNLTASPIEVAEPRKSG